MHGEVFGFNLDILGPGSNLVLLLIIALLVIVLLIRLAFLIFATDGVEEHEPATPQPVVGREWPLSVVPPRSVTRSKAAPSTEPLSTSVMRYLDKMEACNPEPKSERPEELAIRLQKDSAAEVFRSARMERIRQNGWNA